MKCTKCGNEIPENFKFCGICGATLEEPVTVTVADEQPAPPQPTYTQPNPYGQPIPYAQPVYTQVFPEIKPEDKRRAKGTADFILLAFGIVLTILSWWIGSLFLTFIGAFMLSVGAFNPSKTNYCPNCNTAKDFSAKTCPKCGKTFSVSVGRVIAVVAIVMLGAPISYLFMYPIMHLLFGLITH